MKHPIIVICALLNFIVTKSFAQISTFPYFENFNSGNGGWTVTTSSGTAWVLGNPTPAGGPTAYSAPNCWSTGPVPGYLKNSLTYLTSPKLYLNTLTQPIFSFQHFRDIKTYDGMYLEYSADDINWNLLGIYNSQFTTNWYNINASSLNGQPLFMGQSWGWQHSTINLNLHGDIDSARVRFVFRSNPVSNNPAGGVYIDNIEIYENPILRPDLSILKIISPDTISDTTTYYPITYVIKNNTNINIDTAFCNYNLDGFNSTMVGIPIGLLPFQTDTVTIGNIKFAPGLHAFCGQVTTTNDIDSLNNKLCIGVNTPFQTPLPYYQDFENGNGTWQQISTPLTIWEYGTPNYGATTGAHSGLYCWDINLNTGYLNVSSSKLYTPIFDLTSVTLSKISFWLNYETGNQGDGIHLEYSTDLGNSWNVLGVVNDSLSENWYNYSPIGSTSKPGWTYLSKGWKKSTYTLYQLQGFNSVQFRFVFSSSSNFSSDGVSIDDFNFEPVPNYDARLLNITTPSNAYAQGNTTSPITFSIKNTGISTITSIHCEYYANGILQNSATNIVSILPTDTVQISLPGFTINQTNTLVCGKVILISDGDSTNNESCKTLNTLPLYSPNWSDNFNIGNSGWYTENYGDSLTNWQLGTPNYGATDNAHSGTKCWDINLNSGYVWNANTILFSPEFSLNVLSLYKVSFWLNYKTESNWDGTRIEYSTNHGDTWQVMGKLNDTLSTNWYNDSTIKSSQLPAWSNNSNGWKKASYLLYSLAGQNSLRVRFIFTSDQNVNEDGVSIDDFSIEELPNYDVEIINITTPTISYALGTLTDPITITLRNIGRLSATNIQHEYKVNGILQTSSTFTGVVQPGQAVSLILPGFTINQANSIVCGRLTLLNDADTTNNNSCKTLNGVVPIVPPWVDIFSSSNSGWINENVSGESTNWQWGQPNYGSTNSSHSPPTCWDINLNTGYTSNAHCRLYSPVFDLSTSYHPKIEFWQNLSTFPGYEGFRLEYKNGNDTNWYQLGTVNDTNAQNWYTDTVLNSSPHSSWSGNSPGWIKSTYDLDFTNLDDFVQFRYVFTSSFSGNGVSIDDFSITKAFTNDARLNSFISPGNTNIAGTITPVEVYFENYGSQTITSLNINYTLNGGTPSTYTWNGTLPPDSTISISLASILPIAGNNELKAYIDWPLDLNHANDTIVLNTFGFVFSGLPYSDAFENGTGGWIPNQGGNTNWELGSPTFAPLNSSHSGNNCWDINLNTPYFNFANAQLTSPTYDLSNLNIVTLQFWLNYSSESNTDGLFVEYTNDGIVWQRLGSIGDPQGTNWYNSSLTAGNQGWSGVNLGWQSCSYVYVAPWGNNYFQCRFRFISDFNIVNAGASIDDISLTGVTSLNQVNAAEKIVVFPNPANNEITILNTNKNSQLNRVALKSIEGKVVHEQNLNKANLHTISTSHLTSGIYLLEMINDRSELFNKRIIIQHQ